MNFDFIVRKRLLIAICILGIHYIPDCHAADTINKQPSDAEIQQRIVGTWIIDIGTNQIYSAKGTVSYSSNGNYVVVASVTEDGKTHSEKYEGLWRIEGGILTDTITNDPPGIPAGRKFEHARVVRINDDELVLEFGRSVKITEVQRRKR